MLMGDRSCFFNNLLTFVTIEVRGKFYGIVPFNEWNALHNLHLHYSWPVRCRLHAFWPSGSMLLTAQFVPLQSHNRKGKAMNRIPILFNVIVYGHTSEAELSRAKKTEAELVNKDEEVEHAKEKKNSLESYVYETRNKVKFLTSYIFCFKKVFLSLVNNDTWVWEAYHPFFCVLLSFAFGKFWRSTLAFWVFLIDLLFVFPLYVNIWVVRCRFGSEVDQYSFCYPLILQCTCIILVMIVGHK